MTKKQPYELFEDYLDFVDRDNLGGLIKAINSGEMDFLSLIKRYDVIFDAVRRNAPSILNFILSAGDELVPGHNIKEFLSGWKYEILPGTPTAHILIYNGEVGSDNIELFKLLLRNMNLTDFTKSVRVKDDRYAERYTLSELAAENGQAIVYKAVEDELARRSL